MPNWPGRVDLRDRRKRQKNGLYMKVDDPRNWARFPLTPEDQSERVWTRFPASTQPFEAFVTDSAVTVDKVMHLALNADVVVMGKRTSPG